jgi:alpha-mannosidase
MSGKHAAVFPGTLSARTYLKVMARDCEYLLYQVCEPLGALACLQGRPYPAKRYEEWSRTLLQNAVHDCLCGVSVDLVHAKMEVTYRQVFEDIQADLQASLASIFQDFAPGPYALSANPFACEVWQPAGGQLFHVQTQGIGVWKVLQTSPIRETRRLVESFQWKNAWYEARLLPGGQIQVGQAFLGALAVFEDRGDAYSEDTGPLLGTLQPDGPMLVEQESDGYAVVTLSLSSAWEGIRVSAVVRLTFDPSPLIRWQIDLDSRGSGFRVEAVFETARMGAHPGQVVAGMPFDVVLRPTADRDLLPRQLEGDLGTVLMGQREIGSVETFPFHDFVGVSGGSNTAAVLTKGLHAYRASESGTLRVTLRRAVEWLAKPDLATRVGDAGPLFYVPDARCERAVTHELAFLTAGFGVEDMRFHALNTAYQNPPLLVQSHGAGSRTEWGFFQENLPASSMQVANGRVLVRLYNPTPVRQPLSRAYLETDVFGNPERTVQDIPAKGILTLEAAKIVFPSAVTLQRPAILANPPVWRVGLNQGKPDPAVIRSLEARAADLECQIGRAEAGHTRASGLQRYRWLHRIYSLQRQLAEIRLSIRVNEIKLVNQDRWTRAALDTPDPEVAEIGSRLNRLRSQRRIYDYIVQLIPGEDDMRDE